MSSSDNKVFYANLPLKNIHVLSDRPTLYDGIMHNPTYGSMPYLVTPKPQTVSTEYDLNYPSGHSTSDEVEHLINSNKDNLLKVPWAPRFGVVIISLKKLSFRVTCVRSHQKQVVYNNVVLRRATRKALKIWVYHIRLYGVLVKEKTNRNKI
ncbi:hypothetical protein ACJ72_05877 [Emergomyces africanus]|uniref:Uncharacterized protein n=1 Tax=Emergomyces africanus TaxID=1955775 RepID=A0A1B7NSQ5_9EURO|nr:hypothetical protein ACJ72_05877 [Emergomyces africanus]